MNIEEILAQITELAAKPDADIGGLSALRDNLTAAVADMTETTNVVNDLQNQLIESQALAQRLFLSAGKDAADTTNQVDDGEKAVSDLGKLMGVDFNGESE